MNDHVHCVENYGRHNLDTTPLFSGVAREKEQERRVAQHDPSIDDIRRVFHVVQACLDAWDDPPVWQQTLLKGVVEILDCPVALLNIARPSSHDPEIPDVIPLAWEGWTTDEQERRYLDSYDGDHRPKMPAFDKAIEPALQAGGSVACSRRMIVPDNVWYESSFYRGWVEPNGMDDWVQSFRVAPQLRSLIMLGGSRARDAEPFAPESLTLLGVLSEEIVPLIGTRLSLAGQISKHGLTPRQRETLELLLEGMSEKQVARELGISPRTVHDYVVQLHRHFDVSSRGELLSYFVKRRPKAAPER